MWLPPWQATPPIRLLAAASHLARVRRSDTLADVNAVAIIPARYASSRFPAKALARETGKYLIQHVCEQVARCRAIRRVLVATDDARIADAVKSFGGEAVMTREDHPSGTDRVAEAAATLDCDVVVNVQGDEPEIEPAAIDHLVGLFEGRPDLSIATLACPFPADGDPRDPNAVKVVLSQSGEAMYFSRSLIPFPRDTGGNPFGGALCSPSASPWHLHIGVYAYRRSFLFELAKLPPTPLEKLEKLEQLRVLENGHRMAVAVVPRSPVGIDTPEDYAAFVKRCRR
jgi:3-deoxy-manno-octulosonate cytidylyltransferase (CMP-KDO synthetase)